MRDHETKSTDFFNSVGSCIDGLKPGVDSPTAANNSSGDWPSITTVALSAVLILTLFAGIPLFFNTWQAHKHLTEMQKSLDAFIMQPGNKIDKDSLIQIIHECVNADPAGAPGTTRGVMALTITLVVGTSLFFLVAYNVNSAVSDSIKEVLLTLTGALTAIIGFYFGGKAGEASQPANIQPTTKPPENKPPENKPPENKPPENKPPENKPPENKPPENLRTNSLKPDGTI